MVILQNNNTYVNIVRHYKNHCSKKTLFDFMFLKIQNIMDSNAQNRIKADTIFKISDLKTSGRGFKKSLDLFKF